MKQQGIAKPVYEDIHMPKNISAGIYIAGFAFLLGFGFVWDIIWLAVVGALGMVICVIVQTFKEETEYTLTAAEVEKLEQARIKKSLPRRVVIGIHVDVDKDMGLREFVSVVVTWSLDVVKKRRWRTW
jgi:hypothetical protein